MNPVPDHYKRVLVENFKQFKGINCEERQALEQSRYLCICCLETSRFSCENLQYKTYLCSEVLLSLFCSYNL